MLKPAGTQRGRLGVPNGHGAFPAPEGVGRSGAHGQRDLTGPELARKAVGGVTGVTVPQTDTGG